MDVLVEELVDKEVAKVVEQVNRKFTSVGQQTSQELRMLSSVTINCQVTKIVINQSSQLSVF